MEMKTEIRSIQLLRACFFAAALVLALVGCGGGGGGGGGTPASTPASPAPSATLVNIAISAASSQVYIGGASQLTAVGTYSDTTTFDITQSVTWTSSNSNVVSMSNAGLASALIVGSANITASLNGVSSNAVTLNVPTAPLVSTLAGAGGAGSADGVGTAASFWNPVGITTDGTNLYVTDSQNNTIRTVNIATGAVTTLAGSGALNPGWLNGYGTAAQFMWPAGITTVGGNLYVADTWSNAIRKIVINTALVSTFAGSTAAASGSIDSTYNLARFNRPEGITNDGTNLYVTDTLNHTIRQIVIATGVVTTMAGTVGVLGSADGTGTAAKFYYPSGLATAGGNLYVADSYNNTIRKIVISTGVVTTLAGSGVAGSADGTGTAATFNQPRGLTTDGINLYVSDFNSNKIRKIVISTGVVTTMAGSGAQGSNNGGGPAASFFGPDGITTDGVNFYVADGSNKIRKIVP